MTSEVVSDNTCSYPEIEEKTVVEICIIIFYKYLHVIYD